MTHITYRDSIAILQLVFYAPAVFCGFLLCMRHGFRKASGWVLLITFSLLRLAGAICSLIAIDHSSTGLVIAVIICSVMGIAPLTLVTWGILSGLNNDVRIPVPRKAYTIVGSASIAGLVLGGYGASQAAQGAIHNPYSRAAIVIFTAIWAICTASWVLIACQFSDIRHGQRRILAVCGICLPLILVRLIHALIETFGNDPAFSMYGGSTTIYLCMGVLEEIIIVALIIAMGFTLKPLAKGVSPEAGYHGFNGPRKDSSPGHTKSGDDVKAGSVVLLRH